MTPREEDFVTELFICSSHDYILFFTDKGRMYRLKGYEISEGSRTAKGTHIVNLLPLSQGEKVTSTIKVSQADEDKYLCLVTRRGIIKRTKLQLYRNIRKNGINAVNLDENDRLAWVRLTSGDDELVIATKQGKALRFFEKEARETGRVSRGVRAIRLSANDEVVGMARVRADAALLTVSESGLGRRTLLEEYPVRSRGGKGIINYYVKKNGPVAGIKVVDGCDDVILIADNGVVIRTQAGQIAVQSRYGGGVRVMRVGEDSKVVTLARVQKDENGEQADTSPPCTEAESQKENAADDNYREDSQS